MSYLISETGERIATGGRVGRRIRAAAAVVLGVGVTAAAVGAEPAGRQGEADRQLRPIAPGPHPFTIEPGRFQLEFEPVNASYDRHNPDRTDERTWSYRLPVLLKAGILEHTDLQVGVETFAWEQVEDVATGDRQRASGFGNIELGVKHNLWGNDGGRTALAAIPFINLPTHRHGLGSRAVEGGVMLPFAAEVNEQVAVDFVPTLAAVRDSADDDYVFEAGQLVTLNYAFVDDWTLFGEFESVVTTERGKDWSGTLGMGLTWDVHVDLAIEGGVAFAVTRAADDFNVFLAIVQRW